MPKTAARSLALDQGRLVIWSMLLAVMLVVPAFVHNQLYTGPLINAVLLVACALLGTSSALFLGLVPSTVALATGLLPVPLAPMVPFIIIGNALYIIAFAGLRPINFWLGVGIGSLIKFAFLAASVKWVMGSLLADPLVAKLSVMMSWPQLFTALLGGVIAFAALKAIPPSFSQK
jgi:hypothetical protein